MPPFGFPGSKLITVSGVKFLFTVVLLCGNRFGHLSVVTGLGTGLGTSVND